MWILDYKIKPVIKEIRKRCLLCKSWNTVKHGSLIKWRIVKKKYQARKCKECWYRFTDYDAHKYNVWYLKRYRKLKDKYKKDKKSLDNW